MEKVREQLDLRKIPVYGLVPESASSAPSSPVEGQLWFDTSLTPKRLKYYTNGSWEFADQIGAELLANKDATNGYAGLVSGKVVIGQIPTGTTGGTVPFGNDARFSDQRTPTDNSVTSAKIVDGAIVAGDLNAALFDAADGTSSLRQLGYTSTKAMPGVARIDQISAPTATVSWNSQELTNLAAPTGPNSAARLTDVQTAQAGIDNKPSVRFSESTNRALTGLTVDGGTRTDGDRTLLTGQTTPSQNGPWIIHSGAWTRPVGETITSGAFWLVTEGTLAGTQWKVATADPIVLDTTSLSITQWGQGQTYTGTINRITIAANVIDIAATYVGQTSITTLGTITAGTWTGTAIAVANGGTGATDAPTARANLSAAGKYVATLTAFTAGVEKIVTHSLNTLDTVESFKDLADDKKTRLEVRTASVNTIGVTSAEDILTGVIRITVLG